MESPNTPQEEMDKENKPYEEWDPEGWVAKEGKIDDVKSSIQAK